MHQLGRGNFDTQPLGGSDAFETLRDLSRKGSLVRTLDYLGGPFRSQFTTLGFEGGAVTRACTTSNFVASKTPADLRKTAANYDVLNLILWGSVAVGCGNSTRILKAGEACLFPARELTSFAPMTGSTVRQLSLVIPSTRLEHIAPVSKNEFLQIGTSTSGAVAPLLQCMESLSSQMLECSPEEAMALFDACVHLFTSVVLGHASPRPTAKAAIRMGKLLRFIDAHLSEPSLSPADAAAELGVSGRRVQQIFAANGLTFSGFVSERRIIHAAADLLAGPRGLPIGEIAFRWGFSDMAAFRKAFRKVYGTTARDYRRSIRG